MTVIAYRDGVLAADTLITSGLDRAGQTIKIGRLRSAPESEEDPKYWLYGAAGTLGSATPLIKWISAGADLTQPVEYPNSMEGSGLLINSTGDIFYVDSDSHFVTNIHAPFVAIGCGATAARVAMYLDCTSTEAVEAVIDVDAACGGQVTWIDLEGNEDLTFLS